jgi:hypothetical protein
MPVRRGGVNTNMQAQTETHTHAHTHRKKLMQSQGEKWPHDHGGRDRSDAAKGCLGLPETG